VDKTIKTYIGVRFKAKDVVNGILKTLNNNNEAESIELYARGRAIVIAIDVLEIIKRKLLITNSDIQTNTKMQQMKMGMKLKHQK